MNYVYLVVSGSRALHPRRGGSVRSQQWACQAIRDKLDELGRPTIVDGYADGPDRWASEIARDEDLPLVEFRLDGIVYCFRVPGRPTGPAGRWHKSTKQIHPLDRDRAMVEWAQKVLDKGRRVEALGLVAPWSKTRGTDWTLGLAKHCGIKVTRLVCPREMEGSRR